MRKINLIGVIFLILALIYTKELFYGLGYMDVVNTMFSEEDQFGKELLIILLMPSLVYLLLSVLSFLKSENLSNYLFSNSTVLWSTQSKAEKIEFLFVALGIGLIAIALPIITRQIFSWTFIGFEVTRFMYSVAERSIIWEFFKLNLVISYLLLLLGTAFLKYKTKLAEVIIDL